MAEDEIDKSFLKSRVVFMEGGFEEETCTELTKKLLYLNSENNEDIILYIDSFGGDLISFYQIFNVIKSMKCRVHTIAMGKAMSAGALLLLSGTKGYRFAYEHSLILLHELGTQIPFQKLHDLQSDIENSKLAQKIMDKIILERTNIKKSELRELLKKDKYLTAREAKKLGIIDKIIGIDC